jgi:iron complex transport system ATP-binding protein
VKGAQPLALEVAGLSAGYRNRPVIRDLTLEPIPAGQVTALVGPNAAGKSTLLRALAGLLQATGSIRLGGEELTRLSFVERAGRTSYMPQTLPQGVGLSILESVLSALKATPLHNGDHTRSADARERALTFLDRVGLMDVALEPLDHLSGGQRQLASLAQATVRDPQLLLLDEPTSALDLRHQVRVMNLVRTLADEGKIIVAVLHDLNLASRWADNVIVLDEGRLYVSGKPEDAITTRMLEAVYGVEARVEACSRGRLQVVVDGSST